MFPPTAYVMMPVSGKAPSGVSVGVGRGIVDIRQLEYFVQAAEAGSFSAAAKKVYVTQQAISAAVSSLEHELGLPLFDRHPSGVSLTDFGSRALDAAERIIGQVGDLKLTALQYKSAWEGVVGFAYASAAIPSTGGSFSLRSLQEFKNEYPNVDLRVFESSSDACLAAIEHGTADVALVAGRPDAKYFESIKVADARFKVAMNVNHPLADKESIHFSDLKGVPIFPPPDLNLTVRLLTAACERYGFRPTYAMMPFSVENAYDFVKRGEGVNFTPVHLALNETEGIVYKPLADEDDFSLSLYLAYGEAGKAKPAARLLRSYIASCCGVSLDGGVV